MLAEHERVTLGEIARRIARLLGYGVAGPAGPEPRAAGHRYFVPSCTLTWEDAAQLGIRGPGDLFGAVVPSACMGTKAIAHPLLSPGAAAPQGWPEAFPQAVRDLVLPGFSAFDLADAVEAGTRLLTEGAVRLKPVLASGGNKQLVVQDAGALDSALRKLDQSGTLHDGIVLERNMTELRTFSVGRILVGKLEASYYGWQRLTRNHRGQQVFGGSDLTVVPGGSDALLAAAPDEVVHAAIELATRFDQAAQRLLPRLVATRRNYDVLLGHDEAGVRRLAVLEQSWRVGGATGPEIAALETFRSRPGVRRVHTSCFEVYGSAPELPLAATVYYDGHDPQVGRLMKYTVVHPDDVAS